MEEPPEHLGATHWSSRLLAHELGISNVAVANVWRKWGLQPWRTETFKFSTDPELDAKVRDIVALYLNPPDKGRGPVHQREEPDPGPRPHRTDLPMRPGLPARPPTTTSATAPPPCSPPSRSPPGVTDACDDQHRHQEFLPFLKLVARTYPKVRLHIVFDNYGTLKHPAVKAWLAKHPGSPSTSRRPQAHGSTWSKSSSGSSPAKPYAEAPSPASRTSPPPSAGSSTGGTTAPQPFVWTQTADQLLCHSRRQKTSFTRH